MMVILEYLLVGAGAAILLIVLAKVIMAKLLQRPEGYYEGGMFPKMIASAQFDEEMPPLTEEPMDVLAAEKLAAEMAAKEKGGAK